MERIQRLLIANRGEIARRIARSCHAAGVQTVTIFSSADRNSLHVAESNHAVEIEAADGAAAYLNQAAILAAAQEAQVDAIHPGYGFLAENADFAAACCAAGFIFVGPAAHMIATMGDKVAARQLAVENGVPVAMGEPLLMGEPAGWPTSAEKIGYPLLIKAASGGGGIGMQPVEAVHELIPKIETARRIATASFDDDQLYLEQLVVAARHVEVQLAADKHGQLIHLGIRDCSTQRRRQKLIEETPASNIPPAVATALIDAACRLAHAVDYNHIGTVEFLLAPTGDFYFLEMNTRLQVEHTVTEMVTGLDLVQLQLEIAAGAPLPVSQDDISFDGHAIEARLYAEDPRRDFQPDAGQIKLWRTAAHKHLRIDSAVVSDSLIPVDYDPLFAKVVAWGETRAIAAARLRHGLLECSALGVANNVDFLANVLDSENFNAGRMHTDQLPLAPPQSDVARKFALASWLCWLGLIQHERGYVDEATSRQLQLTPESGGALLIYKVLSDNSLTFTDGGRQHHVKLLACANQQMQLQMGNVRRRVDFYVDGLSCHVRLVGEPAGHITLTARSRFAALEKTVAPGSYSAAMPAHVVAVHVAAGQSVSAGQRLITLESMKMESHIDANEAGIVETVLVSVGEAVAARQLLIQINGEGTNE